MKNTPCRLLFPLVVLGLLFGCAAPRKISSSPTEGMSGVLYDTILALDQAAFVVFNNCAIPVQLLKHAEFFSESVEFYHDKGGVTWTRADMLLNTEKYVCGNFSRELVPGSLRVYSIKDFGAIAQGVHKFCQYKSGKCEGAADFLIIWPVGPAN